MYEQLRLKNQLCFPLYAASKEVVRLYSPYLRPLKLTYTQYLVMLLLWEFGQLSVKEIAEQLYLDTGTLSPLFRKLAGKGLVSARRDECDRRSVVLTLTPRGRRLEEAASRIPENIGRCLGISEGEQRQLYDLLYRVLQGQKGSPEAGEKNE
ncbi:MAG: MarR family transcriptional regulator [Ndongobacter sp.]|nr:MarR family transcriptional regulator [Ndongobacter sp.]